MEKFFFDQPIKNDKTTYENIREIVTRHEDDYRTGCFLLILKIILKILQ